MESSCKREHSCPSVALTTEEIQEELKAVDSAWKLDLSVPNKISREFKFTNFITALDFVNRVGAIAEELNHHPDIVLTWGYAQVDFWTHNAQGLTQLDFIAAQKIDQLTCSR